MYNAEVKALCVTRKVRYLLEACIYERERERDVVVFDLYQWCWCSKVKKKDFKVNVARKEVMIIGVSMKSQ